MSRLTDLIAAVKQLDSTLGTDLEAEVRPLQERLKFGLNFERHSPEAVELPAVPVRVGSKVHVLPDRRSSVKTDPTLWKVTSIGGDPRRATISLLRSNDAEVRVVDYENLVVVAEFRDDIYPGLEFTGRVGEEPGKPAHVVINGENYHVLETLKFTHRGAADVIYIDPPYNTGARDWKYNNDYVESDDQYRHSKWLAFMERRLAIAKELLNPDDSTLIVTIDEKEYLRLGLLLEQTFPEGRIQMISVSINPAAVARAGYFGRSDEYYFFVMIGAAGARAVPLEGEWVTTQGRTHKGEIRWDLLRRSGSSPTRQGHPETFYPFFVNADNTFHSVGDPIARSASRFDVSPPKGTIAVWPIRQDGSEGRWALKSATARDVLAAGCLRLGDHKGENTPIYYLAEGERAKIAAGTYEVVGKRDDGSVVTSALDNVERVSVPSTQWRISAHDSTQYGTRLLQKFLPDRRFPFPKSLYAVEDALRFFVGDKPDALVIDFFAGSGTTTHAVMRMNHADDGQRRSILVTNNEVSAEEQSALRAQGLRPGDAEWERWGICDYITKPRVIAAITGKSSTGEDVAGDYRSPDPFPMAEGFRENAEFFRLTYESVFLVSQDRAFEKIAPLLWMRAGSKGRRLETLDVGWAVSDNYAVIRDMDRASEFVEAVRNVPSVEMFFVISDDDRRYQMVCDELFGLEPVRLYESYFNDFKINQGGV